LDDRHQVSSPLRWWGGKKYLLRYIIPLIPPHTCYVEVFGGAGHVFFAKQPSKVEVYNDIDKRLINFFLCLKYHPDALVAEIKTLLHSRELFEMYQQQIGETDLQRAARFYFVLKQSFAGKIDNFGYGKYPGGAQFNFIQSMADGLRKRLKTCQIEQLDFETLIQTYDGRETFFFLDPPYTCSAGEVYKHKFSVSDHHRLARSLRQVEGKWLLGYDDSPFIRRKYKKYSIRTIINRVQTGPGRVGYREALLIANYDVLKPLPHHLLLRPSPSQGHAL
jgi:DNA adenine methylase